MNRLKRNVAKMYEFEHSEEDTFSARAQSARGPTDSGEGKYDTLRETLGRLNHHCMMKFDERNAKLEEMEREIARRRLSLNSASKAADRVRPKVTE